MLHAFSYYVVLIVVIVLLTMLANRLKVAYPILLVLAGLGISFVPGVPTGEIDPDLIFVIFLPPLLYEAAWATSWKQLWKWRRTIGSFAFVVVFLTAFAVAWVSSQFIPGFTLALGFLLGGIVSPPDAVSMGAILKFVDLPKRMASILEGESLLNDASSLIIFRFSLLAVGTGQFIWQDAALGFGWAVVGGVGTGLAVGYLFFSLHRYLPTDVNSDLVFTLVTPYAMYLVAESVDSSGVLSVVSGGLFLAHRNQRFLSSRSRLRATNVWESVSFILNGLVFMLIGLDLPQITADLHGVSLLTAIGYGLLITAVLIVVRLASAYGAVVVTRVASHFITVADARDPGIKAPFILGWAGMRGFVSLAAALSIPVHLSQGALFPQRNLILFITFVVILSTLLLQGLTLPYFIRRFDLPDVDHSLSEEEDYHRLYKKLATKSLTYLTSLDHSLVNDQPALVKLIRKWGDSSKRPGEAGQTADGQALYRQLLDQQRQWLMEWDKDTETSEAVIRRHLDRLDLEEEKLHYA